MFRASSPQAARRALFAGASLSLLLAGCGNQYRPVISAINPVGPAPQPQKYAVVLSNPGPGLLTFIDFSGDTIISTPSVQNNPSYIALNGDGSEGYTVNQAGTLDRFGTGSPASLRTVDISQTTLPSSANVLTSISLSGSSGAGLFIPESGKNTVAALNTSGGLIQEVTVPAQPQYVVGSNGTPRVYSLNSNGTASAIENSTNSGLNVSTNLPVGANPVYGVMDASARRAYVLNGGSQSVTVINVVNNTLDTGVAAGNPNVTVTGTINLPNATDALGNVIGSAANPIWADFNPATNLLVVLSAGNGTLPGVLTLINIPLCNATSLPTNPNCNAANPVDATGFGSILRSVAVGVNAAQVSVLRDAQQPRAYVANSGTGTNGSVSVVDLTSGVVTATLGTQADAANLALPHVFGLKPTTIAATTGTPTGKVYVTSSDSSFVTVIQTQTDSVVTHIPLLGPGQRVVVTQP